MPVIQGQNQDNDPNKPKTVGGQAAGTGYFGSGPSSGTFGGQSQGSSSGRFQNVNAFLNANKNSNIAGGIVGGVQNQSQKVQGDISNEQTKANEAISNQFKQATGGQNLDQAKSNVQNIVNNAGQNTNDQNISAFQAAQNAQFVNPNADFSQQSLQARNLQDLSKSAGTEQGRMSLLQQFNNSPQYSSGQQKLDQLLLQGNKGEQARLASLRNLGAQAQAKLQGAQADVSQNAGQTGQDLSNLSQFTRDYLAQKIQGTNGQGGLLNDIQAKVAATNTKAQQDADNYAKAFKMGDVNAIKQITDISGSSIDPSMKTYGLSRDDLARFLNVNAPQATAQNILSGDQASQINALQKLAGTGQASLADQLKNTFGAQATAGDYKGYSPTADYSGMMGAINSAKAGYEQQIAPVQQGVSFNTNKINDINSRISQINQVNDQLKAAQNDPNSRFDKNALTPMGAQEKIRQILGGATNVEELQQQLGYAQNELTKQQQQLGTLNQQYGGTLGQSGANLGIPQGTDLMSMLSAGRPISIRV